MLTARLRELEQAGVIERRRYSKHPTRYEYLLTQAGRELQPILLALKEWGHRHGNPSGSDARLHPEAQPPPSPDQGTLVAITRRMPLILLDPA